MWPCSSSAAALANDETVVGSDRSSPRLFRRGPVADPLARLSDRSGSPRADRRGGSLGPAIARRPVRHRAHDPGHTAQIFLKVGLQPDADSHRRVLAVVTYLQHGSARGRGAGSSGS